MEDGSGKSEGRISEGEGGEEVRKWWIRAGKSLVKNETNIPHNDEKKIMSTGGEETRRGRGLS